MRGEAGVARQALAPFLVFRGRRDLRILFAGQVVSALGDWLYVVSLIVVAYRISHSATLVALLTFARLLPNALFLPLAGVLADSWDRRTLMVAADVGRGLCMFGLLAVHSKAAMPLAFVLVFVATSMATLFRPALNSVLPSVVPEAELVHANNLIRQIDSLALVLGPALGGVFVLVGRTQAAFAVTGVTALLSAATLLLIRLPPRSVTLRPRDDTGWLQQVAAGFHFLFAANRGVLGAFTLAIAGITLLDGAFWTLVVVLPREFQLGQEGTGFLNAAYGVGGLVGALVVALAAGRVGVTMLFVVASALSSVLAALWGLSPPGIAPYATLALVGVADVALMVAGTTIVQSATPDELLGRAFAAFEATTMGAMVAGSVIVGPAIERYGARAATVLFSAVGLLILLLCVPTLLRTEAELGSRIFLRRVPILSALSLRTLDTLASELQLERFDAGASLIRQGEYGDRLYLLKGGEVEVLAERGGDACLKIATLYTMDYFGETALLRDVPRTATVKAVTAVEVYTLSRHDFQQLLLLSGEFETAITGGSDARFSARQAKLLTRL
jgi:MFS family permease